MNRNPNRDSAVGPILRWAQQNKKLPEHARALLKSDEMAKHGSAYTAEPEQDTKFVIPPEFDGKDYITMLLQIDAEIEHGLMLQYLYSAYSIGGPQIPDKNREQVQNWQKIILGIAKEEMGHFISVQNVLKLIGAPLNFGRESYPWDTPFYPSPFTLEKFTIDSLAKYVYAEAPSEWLNSDDPLAKEINAKVNAEATDPHTVGALFKVILQLIKDPDVISDAAFQPDTYLFQAKFNEWGRGYAGGNRGTAGNEIYTAKPDVLVVSLLSRDDAYDALLKIAEQGEGEELSVDGAQSHFERFLFIYKELAELLKETDNAFVPSRNAATNPYVSTPDVNTDPSLAPDVDPVSDADAITNPEGILWANLINIRYRMLLNYLNHSFLLDEGYNNSGGHAPRGMIINSTFGEMYNLRSIATILVKTPLTLHDDTKMAGPPFTLPYTLDLPFGEPNRWRVHRDLLLGARNVIEELKAIPGQAYLGYLDGLLEADMKLLETVVRLIEEVPF